MTPQRVAGLGDDVSLVARALLRYRLLIPAVAIAKSLRVRTLVRRSLAELFERVDVLAWPTVAAPAPPLENPTVEPPLRRLPGRLRQPAPGRDRQPGRRAGDQRPGRPQLRGAADRAPAASPPGAATSCCWTPRRRWSGPTGASGWTPRRRLPARDSRTRRLYPPGDGGDRGPRPGTNLLRRRPRRGRGRPRGGRGRDLRLPGPERGRQDDDRPHPDHAASAHRGQRPGGRLRRRLRGRGGAARDRRRAPGGGARPADDGARADPPPGDASRPAPRRGHGAGPRRCSSVSTWSAPPTARWGPTRAACAAASTSPRRSSTSRGCCSSTSRPRASTRSAARRSGRRSTKLNADGTTVFLTTQYLEEADQLADRVGIIDFGRIVAEDTPGG